MKIMRILYLLLALLVAGVVVWLVIELRRPAETDRVTVEDAKIRNIKRMAQLCNTEIYRDIPIKASIGKRHIVAVMSVRGSIAFNLDESDISLTGDTVNIRLPKENIEVLESTDPGSYRVIDTWNDNFLGSSYFTTSEENAIKEKYRKSMVAAMYRDGTVTRARAEAAENLASMVSAISDKPVVVK